MPWNPRFDIILIRPIKGDESVVGTGVAWRVIHRSEGVENVIYTFKERQQAFRMAQVLAYKHDLIIGHEGLRMTIQDDEMPI